MANTFLHRLRSSWVVRQWDKLLFLAIFAAFFVFSPNGQFMARISSGGSPINRLLPFPTLAPAPYPVNKTGMYPGLEISATGAVVYDLVSGVTLFGRNTDVSLFPASTTKIMTALVSLEHYDLDEVVTVATVANSGAVMGLIPGEQITVENLLYGALVQSGNDAAWALAEYFPGARPPSLRSGASGQGVPAFVNAMNVKARELHLTNSHFTNPVGFDDPNHIMTAIDLTRLAAFALTNKTIAKIVAIPQITISDVSHTRFHPLTNVNTLLGKIPGVAGIKTGWTEEAGENLVTLVERNGHRIVIVVLKSQNRFSDTETLINWVFGNYDWQDFGLNNVN